jgi:hypothetical protein
MVLRFARHGSVRLQPDLDFGGVRLQPDLSDFGCGMARVLLL